MALTVAQAQAILSKQAIVRDIEEIRSGVVRVETALVYPDGTSIEVFVEPQSDLFENRTRLSDFGQTMAWLLDVQVKPWQSKKRSELLEDALRPYGVERQDAELVYILQNGGNDLPIGVLRLSQACLRAADLIFTRRSSMPGVFLEEVEEIISDTELPYQTDVEIDGRFGRPVRLDFLVVGRTTRSAILTLAANNTSVAHSQATDVFSRWYDLPERDLQQRLTVWDDRMDVYRDADLRRLEQTSLVVPGSDQKTIRELVAA